MGKMRQANISYPYCMFFEQLCSVFSFYFSVLGQLPLLRLLCWLQATGFHDCRPSTMTVMLG